MKRIQKKTLFCALTGIALLAAPVGALAGKSHMLQKVERHVVLTGDDSAVGSPCLTTSWSDKIFVEVNNQGIKSSEEFLVPEGQNLVVTDVAWEIEEGSNTFVVGRQLKFSIYIDTFNLGTAVSFRGPSTMIDNNLAAAEQWVDAYSLTTGFRVGEGLRLCPTASSSGGGVSAAHPVKNITIQGYLIKSKD